MASREFGAADDGEEALHRRAVEDALAADEDMVLGQQPDEIEPELAGRDLDPESGIGHAARRGHGTEAIENFTEPKAVWTQISRSVRRHF